MALINTFLEGAGEIINGMLTSLSDKVFYVEKEFTKGLFNSNVLDFSFVNDLFFKFAVSLIVLKFLKKAFDIYIGWYDGDKDSSPTLLLTYFIRAIITAFSFRFLYDILIQTVSSFLDEALTALVQMELADNLLDYILTSFGSTLFDIICILVLVICFIILWFKFMILGIEMLMLRIAFPLACVGLLDSDKGMFLPYTKKILIICATAFIQIFLLRLSLIMVGSSHVLWGIAFAMASMKTPKMLQEFMFSYGGGGISGAIGTAHHLTTVVSKLSKVVSKAV